MPTLKLPQPKRSGNTQPIWASIPSSMRSGYGLLRRPSRARCLPAGRACKTTTELRSSTTSRCTTRTFPAVVGLCTICVVPDLRLSHHCFSHRRTRVSTLIQWTNISARCLPTSNRYELTLTTRVPVTAELNRWLKAYSRRSFCHDVQVGTRYGKVSEEELRTENLRLAEELAKKQALIDKLTTM
jgi:hypothetical protein|eukprot:COSAG02_NODE_564_length_20286_cov_52.743696_14_plen_185_part_00